MTVVCVCGKTLQIPDALAGQGVICPFCRAAIAAPAPAPDDPTVSLIQALQRRPNHAPAHDEHVAALAADIERTAPPNQPPPAPFVPAPAALSLLVRPRRDPFPYYLAAGVVALLLVVALIAIAWSDGEPPPPPGPAAPPPPETNVAAQAESPSGAKAPPSGFHAPFGDVPPGDSKDKAARKLHP